MAFSYEKNPPNRLQRLLPPACNLSLPPVAVRPSPPHPEQPQPLPPSSKLPLAFLHIPKNAGSAIEDAARRFDLSWGRWADWNRSQYLSEQPPEQPSYGTAGCPLYHRPIDALRVPHPYQGRAVFCVIRSPFARAVSQYRWLNDMFERDSSRRSTRQGPVHILQLPRDQQSRLSWKRCTALGLNDYLRQELTAYAAAKNATQQREVGLCHFLPNARFVWTEGGQRACQYVLNSSNSTLEPDFDAIMHEHGLGIRYRDLSSVTGSQPPEPDPLVAACKTLVPTDIDADNVRRMQAIYHEDFERLGFWAWPTR